MPDMKIDVEYQQALKKVKELYPDLVARREELNQIKKNNKKKFKLYLGITLAFGGCAEAAIFIYGVVLSLLSPILIPSKPVTYPSFMFVFIMMLAIFTITWIVIFLLFQADSETASTCFCEDYLIYKQEKEAFASVGYQLP